jgi:hypothetical protein
MQQTASLDTSGKILDGVDITIRRLAVVSEDVVDKREPRGTV